MKRFKWWHAALFLVAANGIQRLWFKPQKSKKTYRKFKQAGWAPPSWVFAPAWMLNNIALSAGNLRLLNNRDIPGRNTLLSLQALIWLDYLTYSYVYFNKKSPVLSAVWTVADAKLAAISLYLASRSDKKVAWSLVPLTLWTTFASSVALYQAYNNPDPYLNIRRAPKRYISRTMRSSVKKIKQLVPAI